MKREKGKISGISTERIIAAINCTPVDYVHSPKFEKDGAEPLKDARKALRNVMINNLCDDILDPTIDNDTLAEIVCGKKQHIDHISTINDIIDDACEEVHRAERMLELLETDKVRLEAERERLIRLRYQ